MPLPTQKHTKSRQRTRRSTHQIKASTRSVCPKCKKPVLPHRACPACGFYKDKEIIKIKLPKALRKKKVKEDKKENKKIKKENKEQ